MSGVRFNLLHFISDWFRNALFREQFLDGAKDDAYRIRILRERYRFDEDDLAVFFSHDVESLKRVFDGALDEAVKTGEAHNPADWEGVTQAVTFGTHPAARRSDGPAPGWPGNAWECIESVSPRSVHRGTQVTLVIEGWNIGKTGLHNLQLELEGQAPIDLVDASPRVVKPTGRCVMTCVPIAIPHAGTWNILLKKGAEAHHPGALTLALVVTD